MTIKLTIHRAILDWYRRPTTLQDADVGGQATSANREDDDKKMPGIVGMTHHRLMIELGSKRLADAFEAIVDAALADQTLHESKRGAIEETKRQLVAARAAAGW